MQTQSTHADPFAERFEVEPSGSGVLDGLHFAVKDIVDVRGHVTGGGNPCAGYLEEPVLDGEAEG